MTEIPLRFLTGFSQTFLTIFFSIYFFVVFLTIASAIAVVSIWVGLLNKKLRDGGCWSWC